MANETTNYKLSYFGGGDEYSAALEQSRWETVDSNLGGMASLLGNGVIEGWTLSSGATDGYVTVSAGKGFIFGLAAETEQATDVSLSSYADGTYKIMARITPTTYYDRSVTFNVKESIIAALDSEVELGVVEVAGGVLVSDPDNSTKWMIGMTAEIFAAIASHKHTGTGTSPSKIDLSQHVQGVLSADNIDYIPASKLIGGIPAERIGNISHYDLNDIGVNTHRQIDDFVNTITTTKFQPLGILNAINVMQGVMVMGHYLGPEAFRYIANVRPIIPGIVPDTYYETLVDPTRAVIDTGNHRVLGTHGTAIDPPVRSTLTINEVDGNYGFAGPRNIGWENLDLEESPVPTLKLSKIYSTDYYATMGVFFVTVDGGAGVKWKTVEWSKGVYGQDGTYGTMGLEMSVYAKSAVRQDALPTDYTDLTKWKLIGDSSVNQGALENVVENNSYLRLMFLMSSNTLPADTAYRSSPLLQSLTLGYENSGVAKCEFIILNTQSEWLTSASSILDAKVSDAGILSLTGSIYYSDEAVFETQIIGSDKVVNWGYIYSAYTKPDATAIYVYYRSANTRAELEQSTAEWSPLGELEERLSIQDCDDKYIQFRVVMRLLPNAALTPEILSFAVSVNEEEYCPHIGVVNYERTANRATLGLSSAHSIPPYDYVLVTGGSSTFIGTYQLLESSWGQTLSYTCAGDDIVFAETGPGITIGPCISKLKVWNKAGTAAGCWNEVSVKENGYVQNLSTAINGALTTYIDPGGYWISAAYSAEDSSFLCWDGVDVDGENLGQVRLIPMYSADGNNWTDGATVTLGNNRSNPSSASLFDSSDRDKKYIRIKLDMTQV